MNPEDFIRFVGADNKIADPVMEDPCGLNRSRVSENDLKEPGCWKKILLHSLVGFASSLFCLFSLIGTILGSNNREHLNLIPHHFTGCNSAA